MTKDSPLDTSHNSIEASWQMGVPIETLILLGCILHFESCALCDSFLQAKPEQKSGLDNILRFLVWRIHMSHTNRMGKLASWSRGKARKNPEKPPAPVIRLAGNQACRAIQ